MGETQKKEKKKIGLTTKIFIALLAGAVFGIILCYAVPSGHIKDDIIVEGVLYVVGQGFIKLMKMLVVPLVFCSLVCGSMSIGDTKKLGTVGARTLIFYLATTALAVTVALSVGNLINPGVGLDMSTIKTNAASVETMKATSLTDTLLNIIPDNPINSLASGEMLQIIVFALIIGVILAKLGERAETVANFFSQFNDIMMEMTMMIMALAPIGVFCLISRTFANIGFSAFVPLAKYMIGVLIALAIQCFGVYQILLKIFTGLNPLKFIKKFFPVMAFAFSTATSNATIPLSIDTLSKKVGVSKKISSFTIPLGATINMDGTSIMQGVAVVFAAQAFGIIRKYFNYHAVKKRLSLSVFGCMVLLTFLSKIIMEKVGNTENANVLVDYTSPTIVLGSIALLIFFVNIRVDSTKLKQVITILSGVTLGVYLIHDNGLIRNEVVAHLFEDELKNGVYKWALVKLIIVVPAVYVICSLMDLIRSKLFDCVKRVAARFCVE